MKNSKASQGREQRALLLANGPFDLAYTLESGQAFRWRRHDGGYRGVVGGVVFTAWQMPSGVSFASSPRPPEETGPLLRSYLRLDDDLPALYRRLRKDARVGRAARTYAGLRLVRQEPWECLVTFVISAYSNIPRITRHVEDISRLFGERVQGDGEAYFTFPGPERLSEVSEKEFRALGLGYRAKYLAQLAHAIREQGLDLAALRTAPYAEAKEALLHLPGVGEKVADCALAFSLDQSQAFPVDVWVRRAVQEWYFNGRQVTDREVRLWAAEYFGTDAAYAQQYLFYYRRLQGREAKNQSKAQRLG